MNEPIRPQAPTGHPVLAAIIAAPAQPASGTVAPPSPFTVAAQNNGAPPPESGGASQPERTALLQSIFSEDAEASPRSVENPAGYDVAGTVRLRNAISIGGGWRVWRIIALRPGALGWEDTVELVPLDRDAADPLIIPRAIFEASGFEIC